MSGAFPMLDDERALKAIRDALPGAEIEPNSAGGLAFNAGPFVLWMEYHQSGWDGVQTVGDHHVVGIGEHYIVKIYLAPTRAVAGARANMPALVFLKESIVPPDDLGKVMVEFRETLRSSIRDMGRVCGYSHSKP